MSTVHAPSILLACVALCAPGIAHADDDGPPIDVTLAAGPTGFIDAATRERLSEGGAVEVRLGLHTRRRLALELAYAASLHGVTEPSMTTSWLRGVSFELGLRWNPISTVVQPYVVVGLRETYYRVLDWRASSSMSIVDYVTHVPIGVGIERRFGRAFVDLRGTYRIAFDDYLIDAGRERLDTWTLVFGAGYEL
jgi:hypothetical protein